MWFHPRYDGTYLWINAQRWYGATPVGGNPGAYSAYSVDSTPSWYVLDGPSGQRSQVPNDQVDIPMLTAATNVTVTAAASRAPQYLFLLNAVTINAASAAVLQHFNLATNGSVTLLREEVLPTPTGISGKVVFNRGLQYDTPYLVAYGSDSAGHVYRIRKTWAKVGSNKQTQSASQSYFTVLGTQAGWEYYTGSGYDADPSQIGVVANLTTAGPMSFATYRNQLVVSTVVASGSTRTAQVFRSKSGMPFAPLGAPVALGASGSTYLGLGMQLQPQLGANLASLTSSEVAAIPYVVSELNGTSGNHSLTNTWSLLTFTGS